MIVTWNVRGLNKTYKQNELKEFIKENKLGLIAILEHRMYDQKAEKIITKIIPGWSWVSNMSSN